MADDTQFDPLAGVMTPQSLAIARMMQFQQFVNQAGQLNGRDFAARMGGLTAGRALDSAAGPSNSPLDELARSNQEALNATPMGGGAPGGPGTVPPGVSPLEAQARTWDQRAAIFARMGQAQAAQAMTDKANALRTMDANLGKTHAEQGEAEAKGFQAYAEAAKANRFSVWRKDPDQSGVGANKTRYIDVNGFAAPEIREQGNLPDYTMVDQIQPGGGTKSVLLDKRTGKMLPMPGERPFMTPAATSIATDLAKRISTINQGRLGLQKADPFLNEAVGFQATAAQHGGTLLGAFTTGSPNPVSTQAISTVDAGNQLARAALRVTGRYSNAQDKDIAELLPETEGILRNPQTERTKLWGTESQLAAEEAQLRAQYGSIMRTPADPTGQRGLPSALPTLKEMDEARTRAAAQAKAGVPAGAKVIPYSAKGQRITQ